MTKTSRLLPDFDVHAGAVEAVAAGGDAGGDVGVEVAGFLRLAPEVHGEEERDVDLAEEEVCALGEVLAHAGVDGKHDDVDVGIVFGQSVDYLHELGLFVRCLLCGRFL